MNKIERQFVFGTLIALLFGMFAGNYAHAITCQEFWNGDGPAEQIDTNFACLSWSVPTQNADGSPITDLFGYRIYYGFDAAAISQTDGDLRRADTKVSWVEISEATADGYEITFDDIAEPTFVHFGITAIDDKTPANESAISDLVSKEIRFVDNQGPKTPDIFRVILRWQQRAAGGELQHP